MGKQREVVFHYRFFSPRKVIERTSISSMLAMRDGYVFGVLAALFALWYNCSIGTEERVPVNIRFLLL